jgi:hypothetical protein
MKKYFLIGEDIDRTEITAEEATQRQFDGDYRVVVEDDEPAVKVDSVAISATAEPDWEPFAFPEKPGYRLTGHIITRYDNEGLSDRMDSVPADAIKTEEQNRWSWKVGLCHYSIIASPVYDIIATTACGGCEGCKRMTCPRRQNGVKCRNYRA